MSFQAIFPREWARKSGIAIHAVLSLIVFFFFDLLDAALCVVYEFVDEILEGKSRGCYCTASPPHTTGEDEFSETLYRRRNIFREMGFLGFARKFKLSRETRKFKIHESVNRWSDCGCQSCNSWTKNEDGNLHVVVKDSTSRGQIFRKRFYFYIIVAYNLILLLQVRDSTIALLIR